MHHCLQLQWWWVFQVQEFEEEFEKITGGKPTQTRFMRSQQDLKVKMEEQAAAAAGDGGDDEGKQIWWSAVSFRYTQWCRCEAQNDIFFNLGLDRYFDLETGLTYNTHLYI